MTLLLASLALAREADPTAIGLLFVPATPDARPAGTHAERIAAIADGRLPAELVPFYYEEVGTDATGALWHDGQGNVWTRDEVVVILDTAGNPADVSALTTGGTALVIAGSVAEVAVTSLVPGGALLAAGTGIVLQGGGVALTLAGDRKLLDAVRTYNLAHAPLPEDGLSDG